MAEQHLEEEQQVASHEIVGYPLHNNGAASVAIGRIEQVNGPMRSSKGMALTQSKPRISGNGDSISLGPAQTST